MRIQIRHVIYQVSLFRLLCSSSAVRCKFGSLSALPAYRLEKTNEQEQYTYQSEDQWMKNSSMLRGIATIWIIVIVRDAGFFEVILGFLFHVSSHLNCHVLLAHPKALQETDLQAVSPRSPTNPFCQSFSDSSLNWLAKSGGMGPSKLSYPDYNKF